MEEKTQTDRKQDHIDLAFASDMDNAGPDSRFRYEPMLSGHPVDDVDLSITFLGKQLKAPLWVSSMTGGTELALDINRRLAATSAKFGLGMGLGSCRPLLQNLDRIKDFDMRDIIGPDLPLYANLGIAQVERLLLEGKSSDIATLIEQLRADGLIVHINPLQEWLQPEGDIIHQPPIETLQQLLTEINFPVIVKEVGQGMGYESIAALLKLPIAAFELAAHGGTNFSKLELLRSNLLHRETYEAITHVGHSAGEMVSSINALLMAGSEEYLCKQIIISGGVKDFLDGYYFMQRLNMPSIYGQASAFLKYARDSQEALDSYVDQQIRGLQLAHSFLKVK